MANFVLVYTGGTAPQSDEERDTQMAAWGAWFSSLGSAVVDGGNPFLGSRTVSGNGAASDGGASGLTGYSIVSADDVDAAAALAAGCPVIADGGSVEVYEIHQVM